MNEGSASSTESTHAVAQTTAIAALHTIANGFTVSQVYRDAATDAVRVLQDLSNDRDEWKQQHENLLEVRRSDLAALTAKHAAALADLLAACKSVAGVFQDCEDMPIYARKCIAAIAKAER